MQGTTVIYQNEAITFLRSLIRRRSPKPGSAKGVAAASTPPSCRVMGKLVRLLTLLREMS